MAFFTRRQATPPVTQEEHIYLIDTENVKSVWTLLLDRITDQDKVYVFYTMNSGAVSYEAITGILQYGKRIELVECFTGKNGLDFQLVSYLGYMIRDNEKADYCIVSDDGGYDAAVRFWEKKGIKISRKTASEVSGKPAKTSRGRGLKGLKVTATSRKRSAEKSVEAPKAQPAKTQPVKAEPVKVQPVKEQPVKALPVKEQPLKTAPAELDAPKKETRPQKKPTESVSKAALPMVEVAEPQDVAELVIPNPAKKAAKKSEKKTVEKPEEKPVVKEEKAKETPKQETPKKEKSKLEKPKQEKPKQEAPKYRLNEEKLRQLLAGETPEHVEEVLKVVRKAGRPDNLADIHDGIEKIYRDENSQTIYRALRPKMKELFEQA